MYYSPLCSLGPFHYIIAPKIDHKSENISFFVSEIDHTTKNVGEVPPPPNLASEVIFSMEIKPLKQILQNSCSDECQQTHMCVEVNVV